MPVLLSSGWIIFHCMYISHFLHPHIHWWTLSLLPASGYRACCCSTHDCSKSVPVPAFTYFGNISRSGVAGSYCNSLFNFLRNHHNIFHDSCTISYSHQQCTRVQFLHVFTNITFWFCFIFLYNNNPNEYELISHCSFDLHFSND